MRTDISVKTLAEIQADVEADNNDSGNTLGTDAQYVRAINRTIRLWSGRVLFPHLYEFSFTSGMREYALPSYIRPPILAQIRTTVWGYGASSGDDVMSTFVDFNHYAVEPNGAGGFALRFQSAPYAEDGQITWFAENGPLPATAPTLTSTITSTATSAALTVSGSPDLHDSGYVKIESEWLSYAGITRTSATSYTINNLIRGLFGTVAASHNSATAVSWGVGVDRQILWEHMSDQVSAFIHLFNTHKSTTEDLSRHEKLYSAMQARADNFWKMQGYTPQRAPRFILHRSAMGQ